MERSRHREHKRDKKKDKKKRKDKDRESREKSRSSRHDEERRSVLTGKKVSVDYVLWHGWC